MGAHSFFDSVASVLNGIARRHGMEAKLLEHKLLRNWSGIAGEPVASHTRPDQIKFKKLYLVVENSVWVQHLTFLKPELIAKVNQAAGFAAVTDVVMRVGQVSREGKDVRGSRFEVEEEAPDHERRTSNVEPSPSTRLEAEEHAAAVADPELRAKLSEVMAHALTRPRDRSER